MARMPIPLVKTEVEICGWPSLGIALNFLNVVQTLPGIRSAVRTGYQGGSLSAMVEFNPGDVSDLAVVLMTAPAMKRFRLSIKTAGRVKVEAWVAIR